MKFFTFEWWSGDYDDAAAEGVAEQYWKHFSSIERKLPASVRDFGRNHNLHDARVEKFSVDVSSETAELRAKGWDLQCKERRSYSLVYVGVSGVATRGYPDMPLGGPGGFGDLGYDEFDLLDNGKIEHRMLFSTGIELCVAFSSFRFVHRAIRKTRSTSARKKGTGRRRATSSPRRGRG